MRLYWHQIWWRSDKKTEINALVWVQPLAGPAIALDLGRIFKFGTRIDLGKSHLMDDKILPNGAYGEAEFLILGPLPNFGTGAARNYKFGT